jgi:hypothetical protein
MDQAAHWHFDKGPTGRWTWSYVDPGTGNETKCSLSSFASLVDCKSDAANHGYKYDSSGASVPRSSRRLPSSTRDNK